MDRLEKRVMELAPEICHETTAAELFTQDYEPCNDGFRKRIVEDLYICYKPSERYTNSCYFQFDGIKVISRVVQNH